MSIIVRPQVNVNAGDLIFCPGANRAGFVKRSALAGEDTEIVDEGIFIIQITSDATAAPGEPIFLSPIGAPTAQPSAQRIGTVRYLADPSGQSVAVDLNL